MITGIGHLALSVSDMEASVRFYCVVRSGFRGVSPDRRQRRAMDPISAGWAPVLRALYERADRKRGYASFQHLCLTVDDIWETVEQIRNAGIEAGEPKQGKDGNWQAWVTDPDGNAVELMQMNPESPQMKAIGQT